MPRAVAHLGHGIAEHTAQHGATFRVSEEHLTCISATSLTLLCLAHDLSDTFLVRLLLLQIMLSVVEIYCEKIRCLLSGGAPGKDNLQVCVCVFVFVC